MDGVYGDEEDLTGDDPSLPAYMKAPPYKASQGSLDY